MPPAQPTFLEPPQDPDRVEPRWLVGGLQRSPRREGRGNRRRGRELRGYQDPVSCKGIRIRSSSSRLRASTGWFCRGSGSTHSAAAAADCQLPTTLSSDCSMQVVSLPPPLSPPRAPATHVPTTYPPTHLPAYLGISPLGFVVPVLLQQQTPPPPTKSKPDEVRRAAPHSSFSTSFPTPTSSATRRHPPCLNLQQAPFPSVGVSSFLFYLPVSNLLCE